MKLGIQEECKNYIRIVKVERLLPENYVLGCHCPTLDLN